MKPDFLLLILIVLSFKACKKDSQFQRSSDSPRIAPFANAGRDQVIVLPKNSVTLDGSASYDSDARPYGRIAKWNWTKISGPNSYVISSGANSAYAQISELTEGVYFFELKVTDENDLNSTDLVQVYVKGPLTEHNIDITFDINPTCTIEGKYPGSTYDEASFRLSTMSNINMPGGQNPFDAILSQYYENNGGDYFYKAVVSISGRLKYNSPPSAFQLQFDKNINLFKLNALNGRVVFSDSCTITSAEGSFDGIVNARLFCTGTADPGHNNGSIRLQGILHY